MSKFKDFLNKAIKTPWFVMGCVCVFNILCIVIFGLYGCDDEYFATSAPGYLFPILSLVFLNLHFAGGIVLRNLKLTNALKGVFYYQLVGVGSFVLHLIIEILKLENLLDIPNDSFILSVPHYIFSWWVLPVQPVCTLIARVMGVWNLIIVAVLYAIMTYFTGSCIKGIKKDRAFEEKIRQKHEFEAEAIRRAEEEEKNQKK